MVTLYGKGGKPHLQWKAWHNILCVHLVHNRENLRVLKYFCANTFKATLNEFYILKPPGKKVGKFSFLGHIVSIFWFASIPTWLTFLSVYLMCTTMFYKTVNRPYPCDLHQTCLKLPESSVVDDSVWCKLNFSFQMGVLGGAWVKLMWTLGSSVVIDAAVCLCHYLVYITLRGTK